MKAPGKSTVQQVMIPNPLIGQKCGVQHATMHVVCAVGTKRRPIYALEVLVLTSLKGGGGPLNGGIRLYLRVLPA